MLELLYDQHLHSSFSNDSHEDLRNYFEVANNLGIKYVITTEHCDFASSVDNTDWMPDFDKLIAYQKVLAKEYPNITPLLGLELGYRKDYLKEMNEISHKYDFDLIQLSIHDGPKGDYYFTSTFEHDPVGMMHYYFDAMVEALQTFTNFDVLSHIDFGFKTIVKINPNYKFSLFENRLKEVFNILARLDKPLEINCKVMESLNNDYMNNDSSYHYDDHLRYLLKVYKECGGKKLTLSSDAHKTSKYRLDFDKHMAVIKEMGFDKLSYFIKRKEYYYDI